MLLLAPGELTRPTPTADLKGGRPSRRGRSQESSVNRDWSANPHPWTGALLRFARVLPPAETD